MGGTWKKEWTDDADPSDPGPKPFQSGSSSVWSERAVWGRQVAGSNPVSPTTKVEEEIPCVM